MCKILLIVIGVNLYISSPIFPAKIYSVPLTHGLKNHYKYKIKIEKMTDYNVELVRVELKVRTI